MAFFMAVYVFPSILALGNSPGTETCIEYPIMSMILLNPLSAKQKLQQTTLYFPFYFYLSKEIRLDVSCESSA